MQERAEGKENRKDKNEYKKEKRERERKIGKGRPVTT